MPFDAMLVSAAVVVDVSWRLRPCCCGAIFKHGPIG